MNGIATQSLPAKACPEQNRRAGIQVFCLRPSATALDGGGNRRENKRGRVTFAEGMKKGDANLFLCPPVRERRADIALLVNHYCDGERRDVRSEHGQQLRNGHVEAGEIVTLDR